MFTSLFTFECHLTCLTTDNCGYTIPPPCGRPSPAVLFLGLLSHSLCLPAAFLMSLLWQSSQFTLGITPLPSFYYPDFILHPLFPSAIFDKTFFPAIRLTQLFSRTYIIYFRQIRLLFQGQTITPLLPVDQVHFLSLYFLPVSHDSSSTYISAFAPARTLIRSTTSSRLLLIIKYKLMKQIGTNRSTNTNHCL